LDNFLLFRFQAGICGLVVSEKRFHVRMKDEMTYLHTVNLTEILHRRMHDVPLPVDNL
jgi:hypothetical protein